MISQKLMKALKSRCRSATFDRVNHFSITPQKLMKALKSRYRSATFDHFDSFSMPPQKRNDACSHDRAAKIFA
jgi:hypothetical protein